MSDTRKRSRKPLPLKVDFIPEDPEPIVIKQNKCVCCGVTTFASFCACCYEAKEKAYTESRDLGENYPQVIERRERALREHHEKFHAKAQTIVSVQFTPNK